MHPLSTTQQCDRVQCLENIGKSVPWPTAPADLVQVGRSAISSPVMPYSQANVGRQAQESASLPQFLRGGWPGRATSTSHRCMVAGCGWRGWLREPGIQSTGGGSVTDTRVVPVGHAMRRVRRPSLGACPPTPHELCAGACGANFGSGVPPSAGGRRWGAQHMRTASFQACRISSSLSHWAFVSPPPCHRRPPPPPFRPIRQVAGWWPSSLRNREHVGVCALVACVRSTRRGVFSGCGLSMQTWVTGARRLAHRTGEAFA